MKKRKNVVAVEERTRGKTWSGKGEETIVDEEECNGGRK